MTTAESYGRRPNQLTPFTGGLMILANLLKGLVVFVSLLGSSHTAQPIEVPATGHQQVAAMPPEVRLRKLHLVRPDLIPFPIMHEYYC